MKAAVYTSYGPPEVLRIAEVTKPVPNDHEVLIKVHATTVTVGDTRMRSFTVPRGQWLPARIYLGIRKPKRPIVALVRRRCRRSTPPATGLPARF